MFPTSPHAGLLSFIATVPLHEFSDDDFDLLALRLYSYQFSFNKIYQRYCHQFGVSDRQPQHWQDIPAVTTSAFKHAPLSCFPPEDAKAVFHTSGTTEKRSGKHYFRSLDFYHTALLRSFRAYCTPDCEKISMLFLGPTHEVFPHSSLGFMFSVVRDHLSSKDSEAFVQPDAIDVTGFLKAVELCIARNEPVFILGTAFNLLHCMDMMAAKRIRVRLPNGSRILDTGGYKGRTREAPRDEFRSMLSHYFGVPQQYLLNEYGMTELSSQFYESRLTGTPLTSTNPLFKSMPPWVRVIAFDPERLQPLPAGELGMLRVYDLANVDSVMAIQTEDLGRAWQTGIELVGRASDAELRGCSLLTEAITRTV